MQVSGFPREASECLFAGRHDGDELDARILQALARPRRTQRLDIARGYRRHAVRVCHCSACAGPSRKIRRHRARGWARRLRRPRAVGPRRRTLHTRGVRPAKLTAMLTARSLADEKSVPTRIFRIANLCSVVEEFMQSNEARALDVPVSVLRLRDHVYAVRQTPAKPG